MTRKDYELLASLLSRALTVSGANFMGCVAAVNVIADGLRVTNPRFDKDRFIDAVEFPVRSKALDALLKSR